MTATSQLHDPLFRRAEMRALFDDRARVQAMLAFEAALARAQAALQLIPAAAAAAIDEACAVERFDLAAIAAGAAQAGNAAIPLVSALTAQLAAQNAEAARYVHFGATSQDAIDTALVLQLRSAIALTAEQLERNIAALVQLSTAHRATPMAGRTWLQHAVPTTFGLKAAGWLDALCRDRERLQALQSRVLVVQLGGAAGTLASLGDRGPALVQALARELSLSAPLLPWHTQRDRIAETATTFGLLAGTLGKIARDASLLMQTEVGEAAEPRAPGRGGSSSMPQKRNPVGCAVALSAALRAPGLVSTLLSAMVQEHERGLGGWHAEWETLPELIMLVDGAAHHLAPVLAGLELDPERMAENMALGHGQLHAEAVSTLLAPRLGRERAQRIVQECCKAADRDGGSLRDALLAHPELAGVLVADELAEALSLAPTVRSAEQWIDRVLARALEPRARGVAATDA